MKHGLVIVFLFLLLAPMLTASGTAGDQGDPVITLSYIDGVFLPGYHAEVNRRVVSGLYSVQGAQDGKLSAKASELDQKIARAAADSRFISAVRQSMEQKRTERFTLRSVKNEQKITGWIGTGFVLRSGKASIVGTVLDLTAGVERSGSDAPLNHYLLAAQGGAGLLVSADAAVDVDGQAVIRPAYVARYTDLADALSAINLFRGTGGGYSLTRAATRCEALVMMLRLMGEEQAALAFTGQHPFTDVPAWASPYVAYAYDKGYTNGVSAALFGSDRSVSADQYITFILRALAYKDEQGDFSWDSAAQFAQSIGMLTAGERQLLQPVFYRDQMVYVSYYALDAFVKESGLTLLDTLAQRGAVSRNAAMTARARVVRVRP